MRAFTSYVKMGKNKHDDAPDAVTGLAEFVKYRTFVQPKPSKPILHWALSDDPTPHEGYTPEDEITDKYLGGW
jgi:hypothetical protein